MARKTSNAFISPTASRIASRIGLCNSPGDAVHVGAKSAAPRPPVPGDLGRDKQTKFQSLYLSTRASHGLENSIIIIIIINRHTHTHTHRILVLLYKTSRNPFTNGFLLVVQSIRPITGYTMTASTRMSEKRPKPLFLHPFLASTRKPVCATRQATLFTSVRKAGRYDLPFQEISEGTDRETDRQTDTHTHTQNTSINI